MHLRRILFEDLIKLGDGRIDERLPLGRYFDSQMSSALISCKVASGLHLLARELEAL